MWERAGSDEVSGASEGEVKTRLANEAEEPRQLTFDESVRPVASSDEWVPPKNELVDWGLTNF